MEAAAIVKKIRSEGGITRKELARLADVSPSTIGRIERGEMDPTWGTVQKILTSTGYQINGKSVVASGDTSAIRAASAVFEPMLKSAMAPLARSFKSTSNPITDAFAKNFRTPLASTVEKAMKPWVDNWQSTNRQWTERWKRTGWLADSAGVDDLVAIAVSAGNAGKVARRAGARIPVEVEGGWRTLVDRLKENDIDYAVSGLVATRQDRSDQTAGTPFIYVSDPQAIVDDLGFDRARPGQGVLLLKAGAGELEESETEGEVQFVPRSRALLDAFSGPGRDPDKAEDLLRSLLESAA
jgi:DNA-binding XRE family transcriptional regulator